MSEVVREIKYRLIDEFTYEPVLCIRPKVQRSGHKANFAIRLEDLWLYTPDKNPNFDKWMYLVVGKIYEMFNLGIVSSQRMAEVATVIEDGISELIKAPPEPPTGSPQAEKQKAIDQKVKEDMEIIINGR